MFVFDVLKRDDRRLRPIAITVAAGMLILLAGLWFVQVVCAKRFQSNLIRQSVRTVNIPAIRGQILDCNGQVLAEDQPRYNAILYLEDLQDQFDAQYRRLSRSYTNDHREAISAKGRMNLSSAVRRRLQLEADCDVVSNITYRVSTSLEEPRLLNTNGFLRHYNEYPYVTFQIVPNLAPKQVAIFSEQLSGQPALELETQPVRFYPNGSLAAHLLGYVQRRDDQGGDISFTMPDNVGVSGVERAYDDKLRGQPGTKSVLVNNLNYRQREDTTTPNQPGNNVLSDHRPRHCNTRPKKRSPGRNSKHAAPPLSWIREMETFWPLPPPRRLIPMNLCRAIFHTLQPKRSVCFGQKVHSAGQPRRIRGLLARFDFQDHHRHCLPGERPGPGGSF